MISFNPGVPFAFSYPTFDLMSGLFVQASIYDVTTGSPVFVSVVPMLEIQNGIYSGNYTGLTLKSYLVIMLVYTDGTYATIDTTWAPNAECYKSIDAFFLYSISNYGVFDQDAGLFLGANIYDCTSGSPVFVQRGAMAHVLGGVYFSSFTGLTNHSYQNLKLVYTDIGLTTVNTNFAPDVDTFELFSTAIPIFQSAMLQGQLLQGQLQGQSLQATLRETIQ